MTTRPGNGVNGVDNPAFANGQCSIDELVEDKRLDAGDRRKARDSDGQDDRQIVSVSGDVSDRLANPGKTVPVPRGGTGYVRDMREHAQPTRAEPSSRDYSFPSTTPSSGSRVRFLKIHVPGACFTKLFKVTIIVTLFYTINYIASEITQKAAFDNRSCNCQTQDLI